MSISDEWAETDIERLPACNACDSKELRQIYCDLEDHEEGVPGRWSISECAACKSLILNPRPTAQALSKAYRNYYTHTLSTAENAILDDLSIAGRFARSYLVKRYGLPAKGDELTALVANLAWPLRQQLDYFMRHLPRIPGRLLDLGCGSGGFLQRARLAGWDAEGVEPDATAASVARSGGNVKVYDSANSVAGGNFDIITLSHVIEHVHHPRGTLSECFELLRPKGLIWIATPNVEGTGRKTYGKSWQALEIPRHLTMPSASALRAMLEATGFTSVTFLRRGRGAAKRFVANDKRLSKAGEACTSTAVLTTMVDLAASISPFAGEDLVVTGMRPE